MSQDLAFAILGTGSIADTAHAPALARVPGVRLHSVLSRSAARAADFARRHGAVAGHEDLEALLADPRLDAVIVATPDRLHLPQILACAAAGKHVLCEKPLATDLAEARQAVAACREAGVRLGTAMHLRWHAGHRLLRERIRSGALGEVRHMRLAWTFKAPRGDNWRNTEALGRWWSLAANGPHLLDLARWFTGDLEGDLEDLRALLSRPVWKGPHDETASVAARLPSGVVLELLTSVLFESESRIEIHGSEGAAQCLGTLGRHGGGRILLREKELPFEAVVPFDGEIADFAAAIREARDPEVSGEGGLRTVRDLLAISS